MALLKQEVIRKLDRPTILGLNYLSQLYLIVLIWLMMVWFI
jgi:hypothetical protein